MIQEQAITRALADIGEICPSGYAIALHIRFKTPALLFLTYDPDWIDYYTRKALVLYDPAIKWGFANTGHRFWSDMEPEDTAGVFKAAKKHGLNHGLSMSIFDGDSRTLAGFTHPERPHTPKQIEGLSELLSDLHSITLDIDDLSDGERAKLRKLSVTPSRK